MTASDYEVISPDDFKVIAPDDFEVIEPASDQPVQRTPSLEMELPKPDISNPSLFSPELSRAVSKYAPDAKPEELMPIHKSEFEQRSMAQTQLEQRRSMALELVGDDPVKRSFIEADFARQTRANGFTMIEPEKTIGQAAATPLIQMSPEFRAKYFRPIIQLPGTIGEIQKGLSDTAADMTEAMTSPLALSAIGAAKFIPQAASAISGAFAVDMAKNTPELIRNVGAAADAGDVAETSRAIGNLAANTGFAFLAGKHALGESPQAVPPIIQKIAANGAPKTAAALDLIAKDQRPKLDDVPPPETSAPAKPTLTGPPGQAELTPAKAKPKGGETKSAEPEPITKISSTKLTDESIGSITDPELKNAASAIKLGEAEVSDFPPSTRRKIRDFLTQDVDTNKAIDRLKVDTEGKLYGGIEGLSAAAWNGSLEAVRLAIKAGKVIDEALDDAVLFIQQNHASEQFDAVQLKQKLRSSIAPQFQTQNERKGTTALRFLADQPEFQSQFPREAEAIQRGDYISQTEKGRETMAEAFLSPYREANGQLDVERAWRDLHEPDMMRGADPALKMVTLGKVANEAQGLAFSAKNPVDRTRYQDMADAALRDIQLTSSTAGQGLQATGQAMEQAFGVQAIAEIREAIKKRQAEKIGPEIAPEDVQKINDAANRAQSEVAQNIPEPDVTKIVAQNLPSVANIPPVRSRLIDAKTMGQLDKALASVVKIFTERQWIKAMRKLEPRTDEIWATARQNIGNAIARALSATGQKEIAPPLRDYFNNLLREAGQIAKEQTGPESPKDFERFSRLTPEEKLREIYSNREKFAEALDRAQEIIHEKFADDPATLKYLDDAIGVMHKTPFSERSISQIFQRQVSASGVDLRRAALNKDPMTKFRAEMSRKIADAVHPELHGEISAAFSKWLDIKLDQIRKRAGDSRMKSEAADINHMANYQDFISDRILESVRDEVMAIDPKNKATADLQRILSEVEAKVREQVKTNSEKPAASPQDQVAANLRVEAMAKEAFETLRQKAIQLAKDKPELAKQLEPIIKAKFDESKAVAPIKSAFGMTVKELGISIREILRDSAANQKFTKDALFQRIMEHPAFEGLPKESLERISEALEKVWNDKAAAILLREFERFAPLPNLKPAAKAALKSSIPEIVRLANQGALNHEAFYNVIAEKLKLPKFSEDLARQIWEKSQAAQALPEGFARRQAYIDIANFIASQKGFTKTELVTGAWYGGILTRIGTQGRNFFGNLNVMMSEVPALIVREPKAIGQVFSGLIRGLGMNVMGGEFGAIMKRGDFSRSNSIKTMDTSGIWEVLKDSPNPIARLFSNYRFTTRLMTAVDSMFKDANLEAKAAFDAYRKAKGENPTITKADLDKAISDMLQLTPEQKAEAFKQADAEIASGQLKRVDRNRRAIEIGRQLRPPDIMDSAETFSLRATLNNEPGPTLLGSTYRALLPLRQQHPILTPVLAFLRIPANVGDMLLDHSPVGIYRLIARRPNEFRRGLPSEKAFSLDEWQQLRSKVLISHMVASGVGALAVAYMDEKDPGFQVTGTGDNLGPKRKQLLETGWKPYSLKIGNTWVSYKQTPTALLLATIGNLMDGMRYTDLEEKSLQAQFATSLAAGHAVILDQSALTGITQLLDRAGSLSAESTAKNLMVKLPANSLGAFMPGAFKEIDRMVNPTVQQSVDWFDYYQQHNPVGRWAIGRPMLNVLGEPIERQATPWSWLVSDAGHDDPVWKVVSEKANQGIFIPKVSASSTTHGTLGERVKMTDEQLYEYQRETGKILRNRIERNLDHFSKMNPKRSRQWLDDQATDARNIARARLKLN